MMPNVPLHSMVEPNWIVPQDENLESSLFLLEQQEIMYKDHLAEIANIAAPEPIGSQRQSSLPLGIGGSSGMDTSTDHGMMRRMATPHSGRSSRTRVSPRRSTSTAGATGRGASSASSSRAGRHPRQAPVMPSPIEATGTPRSYSGIAGARSYSESFDETMNQSTSTVEE
jgi:hypothetical protein|eukprot:291357_1